MTDENPCERCGGKCCSFRGGLDMAWESLDRGERYDSHLLNSDHLDQLVRQSGALPDMDWHIRTKPDGTRSLVFECNHLTDDGKCGIYDDRPWMCSEFECGYLSGDMTYEEFIDTHGMSESELNDCGFEDVTERVWEIVERREVDS